MLDTSSSTLAPSQPSRRWFTLLCLALVLGALALRLNGLGDRMLSHPENFAPGLPMPGWVSFPPPRDDLSSVLRGTLVDGHPPTYFVGLLAWTEVFGVSLTSLRLPSALLGALSVGLLALVALREGGRWTALLAATLLALHGHHLYWSQLARMYVPTAFLALLSTWFLLRLRERGRTLDLWGLFASTTLALWMQLYAWPLVFAQMLGGVVMAARDRRAPIALRAQILAVIASLPVVQLSIYQNPPSRWRGEATEYLEFGYLFHSTVPYLEAQPDWAWRGAWLIAAGVVLLLFATRVRREPEVVAQASSSPDFPAWFPWTLVGTVALLMAGFAGFAPARLRVGTTALWVAAALPLVCWIAAPPIERWLARCTTTPRAWLARFAALDIPLSWFLAIVPFVTMLLVSNSRGAFVARGTVVFLPFLVLAMAHAVMGLRRVRWLGPAAIAGVLAIHVASIHYFQGAESSRRDYRGLAEQLAAKLGPFDRILVENDFTSPPLIYYLADFQDQLVHRDHAATIAAAPEVGTVWIPSLTRNPTAPGMLEAVSSFQASEVLRAQGIEATAYERREP